MSGIEIFAVIFFSALILGVGSLPVIPVVMDAWVDRKRRKN